MEKKPIEQYDHKGKERCNNPPVELVTPDMDREGGKKTHAYDPRAIIEADIRALEKEITTMLREVAR
ncbi:MAG: hypothetical protein WAW23_09410 [Candidatus Methanoperedens sp.]